MAQDRDHRRSWATRATLRLREVMTSLTRHLHAFVRDVRPSTSEWQQAIDFLTATGQMCDDIRQEFILLSDVLGVSMLVEAINDRNTAAATPATVLGPFHVVESPPRELGDTIDLIGGGKPCVVTGRVLSQDGSPLPDALVDVWQANEEGFYDVQQPGVQPLGNGRGLFTTDEQGAFWFRTVVPSYYPIPTDGPVGRMLDSTGRHPNRPAHIHFIVGAAGHTPVTTHVFVKGSPYIESDAVFGVKETLITDFAHIDDPQRAREFEVTNPFAHAKVNIVLESASGK
ncbi:dioxygenase family protein [Streptomyces sp. NPDC055722]